MVTRSHCPGLTLVSVGVGPALCICPFSISKILKSKPLTPFLRLFTSHFLIHSFLSLPKPVGKDAAKVSRCSRTKLHFTPRRYSAWQQKHDPGSGPSLGISWVQGLRQTFSCLPGMPGPWASHGSSGLSANHGLQTQPSSGARQVRWVWESRGTWRWGADRPVWTGHCKASGQKSQVSRTLLLKQENSFRPEPVAPSAPCSQARRAGPWTQHSRRYCTSGHGFRGLMKGPGIPEPLRFPAPSSPPTG